MHSLMATDHIESLRALRALYVEVRRSTVSDSLHNNLPAGHEQRLVNIQNAISALDVAIRDEETLFVSAAAHKNGVGSANSHLDSIPVHEHSPPEAAGVLNGTNSWPSYEDWRRSGASA